MTDVFLCHPRRSAIGRFGGTLASVRPDDLAAHIFKAVLEQAPELDPVAIDEVMMGSANQAGEDNRNVARMSALLAGLPTSVPGTTLNRLCGSGMDAVGTAFRAIRAGEMELVLAGGVESMSRAPYVMGKADSAFSRGQKIEDTTIGWRFVNPLMKKQYGVDSMPETAENVAEQYNISREDQDLFAFRSQQKTARAQQEGVFAEEIVPVSIPRRKQDPLVFDTDEHPRASTLEKLAALPAPFRENGSVTAGNASGINDGASAVTLMSRARAEKEGRKPMARILGYAHAGVDPKVMGLGPIPAVRKLLDRLNLSVDALDVIESNEAFASQCKAVADDLGLDPAKTNPNGGAIALGHPIGATGSILTVKTLYELERTGGKLGLITMCIGGGQGIAMVVERMG